jgi:hypothetical protein
MAELATPSASWERRIAAIREGLAAAAGLTAADVELRVAASVAQLGICARILAPVLAAAVLDGAALGTSLAGLRWQPVLGGPFPLSVPDAATRRLPTDELISTLRSELIDETARALVIAVRHYSVSPLVAWGNVASALQGAGSMLSAQRPDLIETTQTAVRGLMSAPVLAAAGGTTTSGSFRRRSCCLIYRVGGGRTAICGDCVLRRSDERAQSADHQTSPARQSQVSSPSRSSATAPGRT